MTELRGYTVERHGSYTYHFPIQEPPRDPRPSEWLGAYFWPFVDRSDPFGCWPWTGKRNEQGYGCLTIERRHYVSHRIAWMITRGSCRGLMVLHKCDNKPCVNPHHLVLGNREMNTQDAIARGRLHEFFTNDDGDCTCYYEDDSVRDLLLEEDLRRSPQDHSLITAAPRRLLV